MLKLYLRENGQITKYCEAWVDGSCIVEHWGPLGEKGSTRKHDLDPALTEDENVDRILGKALKSGYSPVGIEDHAVLLIEYTIDGWGSTADLEKRHALEDRMNESMGWTGLGVCDGGSIGSGTMEVCCFVVDFDVARRVIEQDLKNTEFADYSRIYDDRGE